jgi:hypothetical protein
MIFRTNEVDMMPNPLLTPKLQPLVSPQMQTKGFDINRGNFDFNRTPPDYAAFRLKEALGLDVFIGMVEEREEVKEEEEVSSSNS